MRKKRWWAVDAPTWLLLHGEAVLSEQIREGDLMPVDPELLELYVDEVLIAPLLSEDFNHVKTYGSDVPYRAKIDEKQELIQRETGDVALSTHRVALDDVYEISEDDRITMPSRFNVSNPVIVGFRGWTDDSVLTSSNLGHHRTLLVGPRKGANA